MKYFLTSVFILFSCFLKAQKGGTIALDWTAKTEYSIEETHLNIPQFSSDSYNFNFQNRSLLFIKKFPVDFFVSENSLQISSISYESISENELGDLSKSEIKNNINASIKTIISRDQNYCYLSFSPIIRDETGYKKVISLTYYFDKASANSKQISNNATTTITNSVLATGIWKRIYVQKSGIYKITKSFLSDLGFNTNSIDPQKIQIYGLGGRMAPLSNNTPYPNDLAENAIQVVGESDGYFNDGDYILFYGEGMDNWSAENNTNLNLYANKSYYYITVGATNGKRINTITEPSAAATTTFNTFDDYQFHEVDLTNIGRLGRTWFGEDFSTKNEQTFDFSFPNIDTTTPVNVSIHTGANSVVATSFVATANGSNLGTLNMVDVALNSGKAAAEASLPANTTIPAASNISIKLTYNNNGVPTSKGYLDFINLKAKSNLVGYGKQFRFTNNATSSLTGIAQYQFSNATGIAQVWDITDIYNVGSYTNSGQSNFSFKADLGQTKKYIALDLSDTYNPSKDANTSVANQDLKGTVFKNNQGVFQDIDYLIITPSSLNAQAEKLANFHRNYSGLNVKVVNLELIYPEFGGGKQDIGAIRNFIKYVYQNASSTSNRVKYVNLFGDASFDFKDRIRNNTNVVPIYHAVNSYYETAASFSSDDYFVEMDSNEGNLDINYGAPDIAVGRMLISSSQQAEEMVNKVIEYYDIKSYGSWRNNYVAISDDTDKTGDNVLQAAQNSLTDTIYSNKPFINFKKIILDSYQQETSAGGDRYPKAKEDLNNYFEKGALVFNFLGHGGEDGLTGERLWDKLDGANFYNQYRYPLFITITCQFTRFDNPFRPTAGEYTYWNPKGGAISLISTTREISYAFDFNSSLSGILYSFGNTPSVSVAEALRQAKSFSNADGSAVRVTSYIGDPALILAIPKPKIVLTKINDVSVSQPVDDLKALSYIKLSGEVQDDNGILLSNFNGDVAINVFDKNYTQMTLNNDGFSPPISLNSLGETIFRGNASVSNGLFEIGFVVPKDIKIPLGNGRVSFYAKKNQVLEDKTGYNLNIKVGGVNTNAVADVTPPRVRLYMNDETFVNGGITNESPYLLAFLEDEHGINTASGIGHDIVGILDGDETKPYIFNDYYETELNNYTKGKIRFPFRNLAAGLHTLTFKAWDVYNNYVSSEIQFVVTNSQEVTLTNVLNYPNPFVNYTQFWFSHNKPYEPLEVQVQIMTVTGKIVKTINQIVTTEGFLSREINWDGKDDFGDKIGKGVYIYKLTVKSNSSNNVAEKYEKLVIL
ncbi:type IX secretion system sortase PorU [Flavobacterium sp.]|uniref:type IX secretion system sortase PorU n=1 Tax=Flavobacterium sp. TaxID=239 RepID=UPI0038D137F9